MQRLATLFVMIALPALAQEGPVPRDRPDTGIAPGAEEAVAGEAVAEEPVVPLPRQRPAAAAAAPLPEAAAATAEEIIPEIPPPEPPRIYQAACPAVLEGRVGATMLDPI